MTAATVLKTMEGTLTNEAIEKNLVISISNDFTHTFSEGSNFGTAIITSLVDQGGGSVPTATVSSGVATFGGMDSGTRTVSMKYSYQK